MWCQINFIFKKSPFVILTQKLNHLNISYTNLKDELFVIRSDVYKNSISNIFFRY